MNEQTITIKDVSIPFIIKSYKTSKSVKIFFKNGRITITKPTRYSNNNLVKIINQNEEFIYETYINGLKNNEVNIKYWKTGEKIYYKGEEFKIIREISKTIQLNIHIDINEKEKQIEIVLPKIIQEENVKSIVDKGIKNIFRNNTGDLLQERLPYWCKITGINYNSFIVRDAVTRYGSCVHKTKTLRFSSRLIMLPEYVVDAIIVHELCHIEHPNHSTYFYSLVQKYIPNYVQIDKWLKKNAQMIII